METMKENQLEARFRRAVRARLGGRVVKLAPTEKGVPDRMVLLPGGRVELVELKTETGQLSEAQHLWHRKAAELGTLVTVLYGRDAVDHWTAERERSEVTPPKQDAKPANGRTGAVDERFIDRGGPVVEPPRRKMGRAGGFIFHTDAR